MWFHNPDMSWQKRRQFLRSQRPWLQNNTCIRRQQNTDDPIFSLHRAARRCKSVYQYLSWPFQAFKPLFFHFLFQMHIRRRGAFRDFKNQQKTVSYLSGVLSGWCFGSICPHPVNLSPSEHSELDSLLRHQPRVSKSQPHRGPGFTVPQDCNNLEASSYPRTYSGVILLASPRSG